MPHLNPSFVFDLDGGRPCLDFCNTLSSTSGEHVSTYLDLVAFALQSQLITPSQADRLQRLAHDHPSDAHAVASRARELREAIRSVVTAAIDKAAPPADGLARLTRELGEALAHAGLRYDDHTHAYTWMWTGVELNLEAPLWPILRSAADVLTSERDRALLRECGGETCHWLFIDTTRNRTRQWCSMASCGNREKARRHYQRRRAARGAA